MKAFGRLQKNQKLSLLVEVGRALKDETNPCPELTSCVEATAAAVFRIVLREIRMEVELESDDVYDPQCWGRIVRDAVDATSNDDEEEGGDREEGWLAAPASWNFETCSTYVEHLAERILWERLSSRRTTSSTTRPMGGWPR